MKLLRSALLVAVVSMAGWFHPLLAEEWPMLGRDTTRNSVSPEQDPLLDWNVGWFDPSNCKWRNEEARNVKWLTRLGGVTCGDPVLSDGLLWVGTNNDPLWKSDGVEDASVLACVRASDGKLLYGYVSPRMQRARVHDWPGSSMACSPLVEGDRLWFITNRWETVCLDIGPLKRAEGQPRIVWKCDMIKELGVFPRGAIMNVTRIGSIAAYKNRIFVITGNGLDDKWQDAPAPQAPSLVCFQKDTGKIMWQDNSPGANILNGQWASPLVIEFDGRAQVIAPQGDGWVRAFDAVSGELIWKFDMNSKASTWLAGHVSGRDNRNNILATPVFYNHRVYLASGHQEQLGEGPGRLCCIDPSRKGDISSELAVDASGNQIPHRRFQAVDTTKGEKAIPNPNSGLIWEYTQHDEDRDGRIGFEEQFHRTLSSVAINDGLLVACDYSGLVHCFDAETGRRHWAHDALAPIHSPPLIVGDKVYVADADGDVAIFNLSDDANKAMTVADGERAPIKTISMETAIYTSPIFVNGTLYVATSHHLFAIEEQKQQDETSLGHWPQWRGPNRDNISSETSLLHQWPEGGPPLEWQVEGIGDGVASVSIAHGRICTVGYKGESEYGIALDETTGQLLWATVLGPAVKENPLMRWVSQRSPTLDGERAYIVRANGELVCLNSSNGAELWRISYPEAFGDARPIWGYCDYPLVDGPWLICTPGSAEVGVAALNKVTGAIAWKVAVPEIDRGVYGAIVPAEIGGVRQYITPTSTGIRGLAAADGDLLWSYAKDRNDRNFVQSLRIRGDDVLLGWEGGLALLQLAKKDTGFEVREQFLRSDLRLDGFQDNLLAVNDQIYTISSGSLICLSRKTGETLWEHSPPQIRNETLGRGRGRGRRPPLASRSAIIYADGHLIRREVSGLIRLNETSPTGYVEKGSFTIPGHERSQGVTAPVIAGGRLYLRDNNRLLCYDIRAAVSEARPDARQITLAPLGQREPQQRRENRPPRSVFVPTPHDVVEKMLEAAKVTKDDLVYDLGSGDGRIVVAAAKKYGCRAIGYEIDKQLVELSLNAAKQAGVEQLVTIEQQDLFTARLSDANVITLYLLPEQLKALVPQLLKLKPGTRIVSHQFEIPGISPQGQMTLNSTEDGDEHKIFSWVAPIQPANGSD